MQVSWIDADRLKALVAQIAPQESCVDAAPASVEIATVSDIVTSSGVEEWGAAVRWMEPEWEAAPAMEVMAPATEEPAPQMMVLGSEMEERADDEEVPISHLHNPSAALPLSRIRDKLRAIRQRAAEAGILTRVSDVARPASLTEEIETPVPAPVAVWPNAEEPLCEGGSSMTGEPGAEQDAAMAMPAFAVPQGSRDERLAAFASWARQVLHEDGGHVLVMSDDGEVLWGGEAKAGLVLSTMMAWGAAIRASAVAACKTPAVIRQSLASGNVLTVIPCETSGGMIHVAVAAPAALSDAAASMLRGGLVAAFHKAHDVESSAIS